MPTVERHAGEYGLRLVICRREKGDLLSHVHERGMWPDARRRYCTSDHKTNPSNKVLTKLVDEINVERMIPRAARLAKLGIAPVRILSVMGMRAQESSERKRKPVFERQGRISSTNRTVDRWLPIHDWTLEEVWARIRRSGIAPHPVYASGLSRSSCSFCVLASRADLVRAARLRPELARKYAAVEARTGHRFRKDLSMAQIIEHARQVPTSPGE